MLLKTVKGRIELCNSLAEQSEMLEVDGGKLSVVDYLNTCGLCVSETAATEPKFVETAPTPVVEKAEEDRKASIVYTKFRVERDV